MCEKKFVKQTKGKGSFNKKLSMYDSLFVIREQDSKRDKEMK